MEKSCRKCVKNLTLDPFVILVINPKQSFLGENYFPNKIFYKKTIKALKKVNFFFLLNPVSLKGQDYKKTKGI